MKDETKKFPGPPILSNKELEQNFKKQSTDSDPKASKKEKKQSKVSKKPPHVEYKDKLDAFIGDKMTKKQIK